MAEAFLQLPAGALEPRVAVARVNRPALASVVATGVVLGLLPVYALSGRPGLYVAALGIAVSIGLAIFATAPPQSTREPTLRDFVLATVAATFMPSALGMSWLGLYRLLGWTARLLHWLFGWPAVADPMAAAIVWSGWVIAPAAVIFVVSSHQSVFAQLYPNRAGMRSVFNSSGWTSAALWSVVAVFAPALLLALTLSLGWAVPFWLAIVLTAVEWIGSAPLFSASTSVTTTDEREIILAVQHLLDVKGYDVLRTPKSGSGEIDPLLSDLALYARSRGDWPSLAIDVASASPGKTIAWTAGADIQSKVLALLQTEEQNIKPVLIAMGTPETSLREFAKRYDIRIVEGVDRDIVREGLRGERVLSERAQEFLASLAAPSPEMSVTSAGSSMGA